MKWRDRWNVDNILDWKTPQPLADYSPHGISGFDKEGSPSNLVNVLFLLNVKTKASIFFLLLPLFRSSNRTILTHTHTIHSLSLSILLCLTLFVPSFAGRMKKIKIKRIHSNRGTVCWYGHVGNVAYGVPSRFHSINY